MGLTKKSKYDRYSLTFKIQAVKLANHPNIMSKDVAESLGIHPIMLNRWSMEYRRGKLKERRKVKSEASKAKVVDLRKNVICELERKLRESEEKVERLERELESRNDELDLLKKAKRFFEKTR